MSNQESSQLKKIDIQILPFGEIHWNFFFVHKFFLSLKNLLMSLASVLTITASRILTIKEVCKYSLTYSHIFIQGSRRYCSIKHFILSRIGYQFIKHTASFSISGRSRTFPVYSNKVYILRNSVFILILALVKVHSDCFIPSSCICFNPENYFIATGEK